MSEARKAIVRDLWLSALDVGEKAIRDGAAPRAAVDALTEHFRIGYGAALSDLGDEERAVEVAAEIAGVMECDLWLDERHDNFGSGRVLLYEVFDYHARQLRDFPDNPNPSGLEEARAFLMVTDKCRELTEENDRRRRDGETFFVALSPGAWRPAREETVA